MDIIWAILLGALFGYALYKSGASNPKRILAMLRLEDLTLMKTILFAIAFASILMSILAMLGIFNIGHLSIKSANLGVIMGGLIFGFGFGTAGSCPGTCVAAASTSGFKKAISAILGGLLGAFAFSMTYGWFESIGLFKAMDLGKLTLFNISDKFPSLFDIGFAGLLTVGILLAVIAVFIPEKIKKGEMSYGSNKNN